MSIRFRHLEPKARAWMVFANICLAIGLLLWVFVHPTGQIERNWRDAICGFLVGISITINLINFWSSGRCWHTKTKKL